jgi:hypothetical protein
MKQDDGRSFHRSVLRAARQRDDKSDIKSQCDCRDKNDERRAHLRLPVCSRDMLLRRLGKPVRPFPEHDGSRTRQPRNMT